MESAYLGLDYKHLRDTSKETGCNKPCKYKKYKLDWDRRPMPATFKSTDGFGLWAIKNYTKVGKLLLLSF